MSSSSFRTPPTPKARNPLSKFIAEIAPRFFDRALERVGIKQFKWLVLLALIISIPLIITPLEVWQQGVISIFLVVLGQIIISTLR